MIKNLKTARKQMGLSQRDLAKNLGLSQQAIHKYENGTSEPDITTLSKISSCLHVSIEYLIGKNDEDEAQIYTIDERMAYVMERFPCLDSTGQDAVTSLIKALEKK